MKMLIVMAGFFPGRKYGGPPVSVDNFCSLMREIECYILCKNHDMGDTEIYSEINDGWNELSNCKVQYLSDKEYNANGFEKVIMNLKPDVLYLQGLFQSCVFPCLKIAKKHRIKVLLAPRGELCAGAFMKKYKKIPYIIVLRTLGLTKAIHFQSTSEEETESIQKWLGVSKHRIHNLTNIPSIPKEVYSHPEKKSGEGRFVFISRIHPKKNLIFALQCLKEAKGNVQFDIYGPIEDNDYWTKCEHEITSMPKNVQVKYCGLISHDDVHRTFSQYDAFFFPTYSENFGHVIAEALMVGCPVIISNQTPFSDVYELNAGWAIQLDKKELFIRALNEITYNNDINQRNMIYGTKKYIDKHFDLSGLKSMYTDILYKL